MPIVDSGRARLRDAPENVEEHLTSTRTMPRLLTLGAAFVLFAAACNNGGTASTAPTAGADNMDALVAAAKAEGALNVIALPHDWCNYGEMIDGFKAKYPGITVNENCPTAAPVTRSRPSRPRRATPARSSGRDRRRNRLRRRIKADKLVQPYKVATWDTIDSKFKDPDGYWYGDYGSILTFEINKTLSPTAPADWSDLLKPEYATRSPSPVTRASPARPTDACGRLPSPTAARSTTRSRAWTSSSS